MKILYAGSSSILFIFAEHVPDSLDKNSCFQVPYTVILLVLLLSLNIQTFQKELYNGIPKSYCVASFTKTFIFKEVQTIHRSRCEYLKITAILFKTILTPEDGRLRPRHVVF
jgi:hypothetical protein